MSVKIDERDNSFGGSWTEIHIEHMEVLLKDINRLITSEALYFLVKTLRGVSELIERFHKLSINSETIGLNSEGECKVWLNRQL